MIVISRLNQKSGLVICLVVALAFFSYYGLWEKLQGGTSYVRFSPNYLWTNSNLFGVREQDDIKVILYFDKLFNSPWSFIAENDGIKMYQFAQGTDVLLAERAFISGINLVPPCIQAALFEGESPHALKNLRCPEWRCFFTYDKKKFLNFADAILFNPNSYDKWLNLKREGSYDQMWIWLEAEALYADMAIFRERIIAQRNFSHMFNWTMTYHSSADILFTYGYLLPRNYSTLPMLLNLSSKAAHDYTKTLERNENELRIEFNTFDDDFFSRPKLIAWMSSHCISNSRREEYVQELNKFIPIDVYGTCGNLTCGPRHPLSTKCWKTVLRPQYYFFLAMENTFCENYVTEKLYNSLIHGLVPVVWGGANYSQLLPPHSFIDARKFNPQKLALLLLELQNNKVEYLKYHLWRKFWKVHWGSTFCELCYKLHHLNDVSERKWYDRTNHRRYSRLIEWRNANERCVDLLPGEWRKYVNEEANTTNQY